MEFVITSLGGGASWNFYCARRIPRHLVLINIPFFMPFRNGASVHTGWASSTSAPSPRQYSDDHTDVALCDCLTCRSRQSGLVPKSDGQTLLPPPPPARARHLTLVFAAAGRQARRIKSPSPASSLAVCQWSRTFNFSKYTVPLLLHLHPPSLLRARVAVCLPKLFLLPVVVVGVTDGRWTNSWR